MLIKKSPFATIAVVAILVFSLTATSQTQFNGIQPSHDESSLAAMEYQELIEDPKFNQEPTVVINGTSNEFSSNYHPTSEEDNPSYIELKWSHFAGTKLDYKWNDSITGHDPEKIMPDYSDFIYTYQEFEWPYDVLPADGEIVFNYSTYRTGDFAPGAQEYNNLMFRIYAWIVDSSGNWIRVYESRDAVYTEDYLPKRAVLNYFTIDDAFGGMTKENGVQEDPSDTARLLIGLAPFYRFEEYLGTEPWTYYNGSVSIRINSLTFSVFVDLPNDPAAMWKPLYNVTYGATVGDVFPSSPNASKPVSDFCYGMKIDNDGSVYVVGDSRSSYELMQQEGIIFRHQFLRKYNPALHLLWSVTNDNGTSVRAITTSERFVYTTGSIIDSESNTNLIVTKWSSSGVRIWQSEWGAENYQVGVGIGVQQNGTIYVICSDYSFVEQGYGRTSCLRFDSNGNLLGNRTTQYPLTWFDQGGDLYVEKDHLIFFSGGDVTYTDLTGAILNWTTATAAISDGNGGMYTAYRGIMQEVADGTEIIISHIDDAGERVWNATYSRTWPNGLYYQYMPMDISLTAEGTILLLAYNMQISYDYTLLTFDLQGNLLRNRTIGNDYWPKFGPRVYMAVGSSGIAYFAFTSQIMDLWIQGYRLNDASSSFNFTVAAVVAITSSVVVVFLIGGILKRRKSP